MRRSALIAIAMAATGLGCQELNGRATGVDYRGEPLAVVQGRMTADRGLALAGDVRLAIAWFTSGTPGASRPDAVRTESVIYEPVFPAGFSFGIYDLPRGGARIEGPSGLPAGAIGLLLAYDDRNRNGALDTYRAGEPPVDMVLGTSLGRLGVSPDPEGYFIAFVDEAGQPGMPPALRVGLNLVRNTGEVVGFDAVVPIHLDASNLWNVFICEDLLTADGGSACLESINPPADAGVDAGTDAGLGIRVTGSLGLSTGGTVVDVNVSVGSASSQDASVTINGVAVPYDSTAGRYSLRRSTSGPIIGGADNALQVVASGADPLTLNVFVAGDFSITTPPFNGTVSSGIPFSVVWTDSQDAGSYGVTVYSSNPFASIHDQRGIAAPPYTVPALTYQGNATLNITAALPDVSGPNNSFIVRYTNRSIPVVFQ
ncbi:MAG: hypothetical protein ACYC8T_12610 [Myxococcaceae bacterium]